LPPDALHLILFPTPESPKIRFLYLFRCFHMADAVDEYDELADSLIDIGYPPQPSHDQLVQWVSDGTQGGWVRVFSGFLFVFFFDLLFSLVVGFVMKSQSHKRDG